MPDITLTPAQRSLWLASMKQHAANAGHKWPGAAAAEAANETGWGEHYIIASHNVLGIKAFGSWKGPRYTANGSEQVGGVLTAPAPMDWRGYPTFEACFADQMHILTTDPRYWAALSAPTVESYIITEAHLWSTNAQKGRDVLLTYNSHKDVLA